MLDDPKHRLIKLLTQVSFLLIAAGQLSALAANSRPQLFLPFETITIQEHTELSFKAASIDSDEGQELTFSIRGVRGITIGGNSGLARWTPDEYYGGTTNLISVVVGDNGTPPLEVLKQVQVIVEETYTPPRLIRPVDLLISGDLLLPIDALDTDAPFAELELIIKKGPPGMRVVEPYQLQWSPSLQDFGKYHEITLTFEEKSFPFHKAQEQTFRIGAFPPDNSHSPQWNFYGPNPIRFRPIKFFAIADRLFLTAESGRFYSSLDGAAWVECDTGSLHDIVSIAGNGSIYYLADSMGGIFSTADLLTFKRTQVPRPGDLRGLAFFQNKLYAAGLFGAFSFDPQTEQWSELHAQPLPGIATGNGVLVLAGEEDFNSAFDRIGIFITTSDGISWTTNTFDHAYLPLHFEDGEFIAGALSSSDGLQWRLLTADPSVFWTRITKLLGEYYAWGDSAHKLRQDGTWEMYAPLPGPGAIDVIEFKGKFYACGAAHGLWVASSLRGPWINLSKGTRPQFSRVQFKDGKFFATAYYSAFFPDADKKTYVTADGKNWAPTLGKFPEANFQPPAGTTPPSGFHTILFGNGRYLALGGPYNRGQIAVSVDGKNWDIRSKSRLHGAVIHFVGGVFVAAENHWKNTEISWSFDGLTWVVGALRFPDATHFVHGNGILILTGTSMLTATAVPRFAHQQLIPPPEKTRIHLPSVDGIQIEVSSNLQEWRALKAEEISEHSLAIQTNLPALYVRSRR